jgi:hypothetical protein
MDTAVPSNLSRRLPYAGCTNLLRASAQSGAAGACIISHGQPCSRVSTAAHLVLPIVLLNSVGRGATAAVDQAKLRPPAIFPPKRVLSDFSDPTSPVSQPRSIVHPIGHSRKNAFDKLWCCVARTQNVLQRAEALRYYYARLLGIICVTPTCLSNYLPVSFTTAAQTSPDYCI